MIVCGSGSTKFDGWGQ